jgi:hypothetical protein
MKKFVAILGIKWYGNYDNKMMIALRVGCGPLSIHVLR